MSPIGIAVTVVFFVALLIGLVFLLRQQKGTDALKEQGAEDEIVYRSSVQAKTKGWAGWAPINSPTGVELTIRRNWLQLEWAGVWRGVWPGGEHFLPVNGARMKIANVPFPFLVRRRSIVLCGTELDRPLTLAVYSKTRLDEIWTALESAGVESVA